MQTARSLPGEQTFRCLDGLRGYMAWCVVASHFVGLLQIGRDIPRFLLLFVHGAKAVNEFIILSGFVIAHLIVCKQEPYRAYMIRRAFRIVPIYLVCLLIAIVVGGPQPAIDAMSARAVPETLTPAAISIADNPWPYVWLHLTLLHGVVPDSMLPGSASAFLGPAWSLSLEWQFYLLAPCIVWLLRKSIASLLIVTIVFLAAYFLFTSGQLGYWKYPSLLFLSIHLFLIGIFSRLWLDAMVGPRVWFGPALLLIIAALLPTMRWELAIWSFFYIALLSERFASALPRWIAVALRWTTSNRAITALGRISYSTYLVHLPVFSMVLWLAFGMFGVQDRSVVIACMVLAALSTIPVSFLLYWLIEARFIRIGRRFHAKLPSASTGSASVATSART